MISISLSEKYDDLVESVSLWYRFFRERGIEPGRATSRVIGQLQNVMEANRYLLMIAYFILLEEVLGEPEPDEEVVLYVFDNLTEDFKDELKLMRVLVGQLLPEQRDDFLQHLEIIHQSLISLSSPSMIRLSQQLVLVG